VLSLGEAQLGAKKYSDAATTLRRAAQMNGNDWLPLYYLGQAQTALAQYQTAESTLRGGLSKASSENQRLVWKQLGFVYEKQKDFAQAKAAYQRIGDQAAVARVSENERIALENRLIEEQNLEIERLKQEAAELEAQMEDLPPE
jgi:tetratricopeptide (TPR) repeat protein